MSRGSWVRRAVGVALICSLATAAGCSGNPAPEAVAGRACGPDVDPPPPRNAPLPTVDLASLGETTLSVSNQLNSSVDIFWVTRDQLYPFPVDRLRLEAVNLGRALPGSTTLTVPAGLPPGSFYKLRSEPVPGRGGAPVWSLSPEAWRRVRIRLTCPTGSAADRS